MKFSMNHCLQTELIELKNIICSEFVDINEILVNNTHFETLPLPVKTEDNYQPEEFIPSRVRKKLENQSRSRNFSKIFDFSTFESRFFSNSYPE